MNERTDIPAPPARPDDGHKGTFGTVIVIGGSATMIGAPALCARSAFRGGAGLVKIAAKAALLPHILTIEPSATGLEMPEPREVPERFNGEAVLAVGPGWGTSARNLDRLDVILRLPNRVVLDADGLNLLANPREIETARQRRGPLVLTPHPGEYRRLAEPLRITLDPTDPDQRVDAAAALAHRLNAVVLLKGRHTVISDGQTYAINRTGNPALATAGSGDVLTGLLAAMLAQDMPPLDAAILAAYAHGLAADQWTQRHGRPAGMLATDLADGLPAALASLPK
jgi:NAD(P)H-hydrate epimerase